MRSCYVFIYLGFTVLKYPGNIFLFYSEHKPQTMPQTKSSRIGSAVLTISETQTKIQSKQKSDTNQMYVHALSDS